MSGCTYQVSISHSSLDLGIVQLLAERICRQGAGIFYHAASGYAGSEFTKEIRENIVASDELLVLVTPAYLDSPWLGFELGIASDPKFLVVPILQNLKREELSAHPKWSALLGDKTNYPLEDFERYLAQLQGRIAAKLAKRAPSSALSSSTWAQAAETNALLRARLARN